MTRPKILDLYLEETHPNANAVNSVIERAAQLTAEEAKELAAAWDAAWGAPENSAHRDAWNSVQYTVLYSERAAAGEAAWAAAWDAAPRRDALDAAWVSARVSAGDAAQAAVVRDLISDETYATLAGPWESVMGRIFNNNDKQED